MSKTSLQHRARSMLERSRLVFSPPSKVVSRFPAFCLSWRAACVLGARLGKHSRGYLAAPKLIKLALGADQFLEGPVFNDGSSIHYDNPVCLAGGTKAMRDEDPGT